MTPPMTPGRRSIAVLSLLLRLFPARFRRAFGREMAEVFAERCAEVRSSGRRFGVARLWIRTVVDLVRSAAAARLDARGRPRPSSGPRVATVIASVGQDVRFGLRACARQPAFSAVVLGTLAVGIGATTAMFSLLNWVVLRPVPGVTEPARLATVRLIAQNGNGAFFITHPEYALFAERLDAFADLAAWQQVPLHVAVDARQAADRVSAEIVTANYFDVLGMRPPLGRGFLPSEGTAAGARPVAVASDRFWRRALGADPAAIGRDIVINGEAFTVVGVAPPGFQGVELPGETALWVPAAAHRWAMPQYPPDLLTDIRVPLFLQCVGRLRAGASIEMAQAQADALGRSLEGSGVVGKQLAKRSSRLLLEAGLARPVWTRERIERAIGLLLGAVGLVLLLACANVANLMLARMAGRRREMAVRGAVGAGRARLVRQLLVESFTLATAGGALGLVLGYWLVGLLQGVSLGRGLPTLDRVGLDARVLMFALGVSLTSGVLFGLAPAFGGGRFDLVIALKDGARPVRRALGPRGVLVAVQFALSLALVTGAGLLLRSLANLRGVDPGFDVRLTLQASVDPGLQGYSRERAGAFFQHVLDRVREQPTIEAAALAWSAPFALVRDDTRVTLPDGDPDEPGVSAVRSQITPGYFATLGLRLIGGRDFTEREWRQAAADGPGVVIVSRSLAEALVGSRNPVGQSVKLSYRENRLFEIVGVVADARTLRVTVEPGALIYEPLGQLFAPTSATLLVRPGAGVAAGVDAVRRVVGDLDPALPVYDIGTSAQAIDGQIAQDRLVARLAGLFAAIAALLAGLGLYGVVAQAVTERTRELGVRLALGARPGGMIALVLRQVFALALPGAALGVLAGAGIGRAIESRLYGVGGLDAVAFLAAAVGLTAVALLAAWRPAWRAARVDPSTVLRE